MGLEAAVLGPVLGAGIGLIGSSMAADAASSAAAGSSAAQLKAAQMAAEAQKFRPVGMTTRFGKSTFEMTPDGYLKSAGYELTPELKSLQDRILAMNNQRLAEAEMANWRYAPLGTAAQQTFGLGSQYLGASPEAVAADYMRKQQDLLAPSRERQFAQLQNQLYQTGRGGLSVGATGVRPGGGQGLRAANPEMEAYYNALAQQDAALAAQADQEARNRITFGTGLFGAGSGLLDARQAGLSSAITPFTTNLGAASSLESLGQQPLDIGAQLGGRAATAGANVGSSLLQGGLAAATLKPGQGSSIFGSALQGLASNPQLTGALGQWVSTQTQPRSIATSNMPVYNPIPTYSPSYGGGVMI